MRGIYKRLSYEDRFSRHYACWVKNNRKKWHWYKRQGRRTSRRKLKDDLKEAFLDMAPVNEPEEEPDP